MLHTQNQLPMLLWCVVGFFTDTNTTPTQIVLSCFGLLVGLWQLHCQPRQGNKPKRLKKYLFSFKHLFNLLQRFPFSFWQHAIHKSNATQVNPGKQPEMTQLRYYSSKVFLPVYTRVPHHLCQGGVELEHQEQAGQVE